MKHTCHLPGCAAACPPRWLFCSVHWSMVPPTTYCEAQATDAVLWTLGRPEPALLEKAMAFADKLELTTPRP